MKRLKAIVIAALVCAAPAGAAEPGQTGSTVITEFQDWTLICHTSEAPRKCLLKQAILDTKSGNVIGQLVFEKDGEADVLVLELPLNTMLEDEIGIELDGRIVQTVDYTTCIEGGCIGRISAEQIAPAFNDAKDGMLVVYTSAEKQVALPFSLNGFKAAWRSYVASLHPSVSRKHKAG